MINPSDVPSHQHRFPQGEKVFLGSERGIVDSTISVKEFSI